MKTKIKKLLDKLAYWFLDRLSDEHFVELIFNCIKHRTKGVPAAQSLKLLFSLDALLYQEQGKFAVEYDGGIHTKHRHMKYHDFFIKRIQATQNVLDIGCGIGAVAFDIAEKAGAHVVGIDLSDGNIDQARKQYSHPHVEYRVGDALKDLPEETFDVVVLSNVLEHLRERASFLRNVVARLKPKIILIRVPVFERDWRVPLKKELGVEWRLDATHETEYTLESFAKEIADADLCVNHLEVRWGEIWSEVGSK